MSTQLNRRDCFRLSDTFDLQIRVLDEDTYQQISGDFHLYRKDFCLKSHAQNQKDINQPRLLQIRNRHQDIANYLEYLESRLIQLTEQVEKLSSRKEQEEVLQFSSRGDLSANGIKFSTTTSFTEGQHLEVSLVLNTSDIRVLILGDVVRIDRQDGKEEQMVSVTFNVIHEEDREAITRHLIKLQQELLRASRSSQASG